MANYINLEAAVDAVTNVYYNSAGDGSSWVLTPTKDVTHTTMS